MGSAFSRAATWASRVHSAISLGLIGISRAGDATRRAIWRRLTDNALAREASIGFVLAAIGIVATVLITNGQNRLARDLETASEIQENVRFLRQVVADNATAKPFRALNLSGASLGGLDLASRTRDPLLVAPT